MLVTAGPGAFHQMTSPIRGQIVERNAIAIKQKSPVSPEICRFSWARTSFVRFKLQTFTSSVNT